VLKISDEARGRLLALRRGPGWEELLDIGEKLCQLEETELLKMDRSKGTTAEQILSKQDQCRGFRLFFETLQIEIAQQEQRLIELQEGGRQEPGVIGLHEPVFDRSDVQEILGLIPEG